MNIVELGVGVMVNIYVADLTINEILCISDLISKSLGINFFYCDLTFYKLSLAM